MPSQVFSPAFPLPVQLAFYVAVRDDVRAGNTEDAIDRIEREFRLQV